MTKYIIFVIPFFLLAIIAEATYSNLVLKKKLYSFADTITSLCTGILSQTFRISTILQLIIYKLVYTYCAILHYPLHSIWFWILAVIFYDFLYYWYHRIGHERILFWSNHVVHHSSEYYNLTTALRQPGVLGIHSLFMFLPLAIIGVPPQMYIILAVIDLYYQFWVHTECIGKLGWFDKIFVSPTNHSVHHGVNPYCIDKNYGGILIIWDRIFGTYSDKIEPVKYGTMKPVKSWNPLWINIEVYYSLIRDFICTRTLGQKIKVLTARTGWRSEDALQKFPSVNFDLNSRTLYNPALDVSQLIYVLLKFSMIFIVSLYLISKVNTLSYTTGVCASTAILSSMIIMSLAMSGKYPVKKCVLWDILIISVSFAFIF